jgi:undecaprenyl-diphosphatase
MSFFEAIILGILQGLTEFLPISSSGHLEIVKSLFGVHPDKSFFFTIAVHGATVLSTLVVFRKEIFRLFSGLFEFKLNDETIYLLKLVISMIPVGIAGLFFRRSVEAMFSGNIVLIGSMLIVTSIILALGHFSRNSGRPITYQDAFIIGIAQAIAVIPGISRSGSTISTGLVLGNSRNELAKFSFLMVLVPVIGVNFLEIFASDKVLTGTNTGAILIGAAAAFGSGFLACKLMINLVKKSKMIWFSIYCLIIGLITILFL